jgi:peptidoglycan/xylan/chitin deacetylase (PgdA/CDA1 family)
MKISFSFDDGSQYDQVVMEYLKKVGLYDATFFIPLLSWGYNNLELYNDFNVGGHTYNHPQDLKRLTDEQLTDNIIISKKHLDAVLGYKTTIFCYPRGRYDQRVIKYVEKAGYKWARTTKVGIRNESRYELEGLHLYQRKEYEGVDWLEYIIKVFEKNPLRWIHIWGHSWELEEHNEWNKFVKLLNYVYENSNSKRVASANRRWFQFYS